MNSMRQLAPPAQLDQHLEDLRAHRHVEHRDRLVADQPVRLEHERGGDRHALALPARELVRVAVEEALRAPGRRPPARAARARRGRRRRDALHAQRLGDDRRHALARVERLVGVLEDHLDAAGAARAARRLPSHRRAVGWTPPRRSAGPARAARGRASTCRSRTPRPRRGSRRGATRARRRRRRVRPSGAARKCTLRSRTSIRSSLIRPPPRWRPRAASATRPTARSGRPPTGPGGPRAAPGPPGSGRRRRGSAAGSGSPPAASPGSGGPPGIGGASSRAPPITGSESSRRFVYGCWGAANTSRTGPVSTIRPAYMTAIRSQVSASTARSWLIRISASPSSLAQAARAGRGSAPA